MRESLERILKSMPAPAIAVSGGVDSVTLAALAVANRPDVLLMHAVSPAVPAEATARLETMAASRGWRLLLLDAGEFDDPNYRTNPVDRCFYCKSSLYHAIRARTDRPILSGANLDDLGEYRPGLLAAKRHDVRHPYVEAGLDKKLVRQLARDLELHEVAELPASPCLSSRVETGIRIDATVLQFIHRVELAVRGALGPRTVRCRIRAAAIVVELDAETLARLSPHDEQSIQTLTRAQPNRPPHLPILIEPYRNGSAFLRDVAALEGDAA